MIRSGALVEPWSRRAAFSLLLGAAYFLTAYVSVQITSITGSVAAVWPANGIVVAALLVSPTAYWLPHSLAVGSAIMLVSILTGDGVIVGLGFVAANLTGCLVAATVLRRRNVGPAILDSLRNVLVFVPTVVAAAAASATLGAAMVSANFGGSYWDVWPGWWIAELLALLIVTPLLTAWWTAPAKRMPAWGRVLEVAVLLAGSGAVAFAGFGGMSMPPLLWPLTLFLAVPFQIWASIRFDQRVPMATALSFLVGGTLGLNIGGATIPLAETTTDALLLLQAVLTLTSIEAMVLIAAMSQRRRAEGAARAAEARLRDAIASMSDGFELFDSDDRLELFNERSRELMPELADFAVAGTPFQEIVRAGAERGLYLDAGHQVETWISHRLQRRREASDAYELRLANGRCLLVRERRTSDGGTVCIRSDITQLKEQEQIRLREVEEKRRRAEAERLAEAIRAREAVARGVLDTALDAYVRMDEDGRITEWNLMAERTFGWSRDEAMGRRVADLMVPPNFKEAHRKGLARFLATGEARVLDRRMELIALDRSGRSFPVELTIVALETDGGRVFSAFIRDLTEKKQAEEQLRQVQKMEAVGQLTGGVAHDFNNLLAVIMGSLDLAGEQTAEGSPVAGHVKRALVAAEKGAALTHRLLAFSRNQALQPVQLDLNQTVAGMVDLLQRTLGEHIEMDVRLQEDLWSALADKTQVESSLLNLAINARDAMPDGGTLTLETANVTLDENYAAHNPGMNPGNYVMLAVTDNGTGMLPEVMERVFEPFFTTKEIGKGSGLGLPMIYGFAKQSGGHLKIYSEVDYGTTVRLYLPRMQSTAPTAIEVPPDNRTHDISDARILVVEDNPAVRNLVMKQLRSFGCHAVEMENAAAALAFLEREDPVDLLFTDVVMPGGMSGLQLAERAGELRPGLKVLLTSGFAEPIVQNGARRHRLLGKPYRLLDLAQSVRDALNEAVN